jgi:hypothetical protein
MPENVYGNITKDQFLKEFNFKNNPQFVLHFIANNNPGAVLQKLKDANLINSAQETDPDLVFMVLNSLFKAGRTKQIRELVRVPLNTAEPNTITPATLEALTDLQSTTKAVK